MRLFFLMMALWSFSARCHHITQIINNTDYDLYVFSTGVQNFSKASRARSTLYESDLKLPEVSANYIDQFTIGHSRDDAKQNIPNSICIGLPNTGNNCSLPFLGIRQRGSLIEVIHCHGVRSIDFLDHKVFGCDRFFQYSVFDVSHKPYQNYTIEITQLADRLYYSSDHCSAPVPYCLGKDQVSVSIKETVELK